MPMRNFKKMWKYEMRKEEKLEECQTVNKEMEI